jgi:hemerythrin-like domain-containing protein
MTTSTQNLENDHVHILRLIDVMEKMTKTENPDYTHLELVVYLIRNFADGLHHAKEEKMLFPLMIQKGFSDQQGPIAVMLHDHNEGRGYVKGIADNIESYKKGNTNALSDIFSNMKEYIDLLREHIGKENNVLFRMADNVLSADEQKMLLGQFINIDKGQGNQPDSNGFIEKIEILAKDYNL